MSEIIEEQILPYPYTYLPAKVVRERDELGTRIKWYDLETNQELCPYFGYGEDAQKQIDDWIRNERKD